MRPKGNCGSIKARKKEGQRSKEVVSEHRRVVEMTDRGILTERKRREARGGQQDREYWNGKDLNYDDNDKDMIVVVLTLKSKNARERGVCLVFNILE